MKIREVMTNPVIRISGEETVEVAARTLAHYNIGALMICGADGRMHGLVTDRDIVTRCIATGHHPGRVKVSQIMSGGVVGISPDLDVAEAAEIMGTRQVRRLPVLENERLCGVVSLGDLVRADADTAQVLSQISSNIRPR